MLLWCREGRALDAKEDPCREGDPENGFDYFRCNLQVFHRHLRQDDDLVSRADISQLVPKNFPASSHHEELIRIGPNCIAAHEADIIIDGLAGLVDDGLRNHHLSAHEHDIIAFRDCDDVLGLK